VLASALALVCCAAPPAVRDYPALLAIEGDPGAPLAGVEVTQGAHRVGESDRRGTVALQLRGTEGQVVALQIHCPVGYRSPPDPLSVVLRRISESDRSPIYPARCEPLLRTVVVVVRGDRGPGLPVLFLGREVARTDSAGAAHLLLKSSPEDTVELTLDTSGNPGLRPKNPSARFRVGAHDDLLVFSQKFEPAKVAKRPAQRAPRIIKIGPR
jgi:hypothetical protein